jgi:hypothetical protein
MIKKMKGEKGQAMAIVLALVAFGGLVITPFLDHAGSGLIGSRLYGEAICQQYAGDAGVEHAIWDLRYSDLAGQIPNPGDSTSYQLSEAVNGIEPIDITVSRGWETIASDNFESGGWAGGTGWLGDWYQTGDASIVTSDSPYEGSYHLQLRSDTGYVSRSVDLNGLPSARLRFWAKADSIEGSEEVRCLISTNGDNWTTVHTWVNGDDDNTYRFYNIDLSPYAPYGEFWISFEAAMGDANDYFYVDDIKVVWAFDTVAPVASDNFESGGWAGGTGWLGDWYQTGDASIVTSDSPYEGSYHLRLRGDTGYVSRSVDFSSQPKANLQFWAKADDFESGEQAWCLISENGTAWTTVHTWVDGDDDNTYRFYNIDLSSYSLSDNFSIAFQAAMSNASDYFYADDIKITGPRVYGIRSIADGRTIRAAVEITGGTVNVLWWLII